MAEKVIMHRPADASDPGFTIPGKKLRWISGRVRERSDSSGIWVPLRKSDLDKETIGMIERRYPGAFSDGDTIRRGNGELTLAYADSKAAADHRKYLDQLAYEQKSRSRVMPADKNPGRNDYTKLTEYEESDSTIPRQFLEKKKAE